MPSPSPALTKLLSPLCSDAWVECDSCQIWRRVPKNVSDRLGDDEQWFCHLNNDHVHDSCEAPQEISNDEIDILLNAQTDAEEAAEILVARRGKPGSGGGKPGSGLGDLCQPVNGAGGGDSRAAGTAQSVWHRIHRNIFTHREPKSVTEDDVLICSCTPHPVTGAGCGDECINRDVLVECDPGFCPCGEGCQNQKFSRKQYAKLDIARTGRKGHGLFAKQGLRKGQFIIEYIGEVLHEDEYRVRKQRYEDEARRHYYFMTLSSSETIDAAERGNAGRFLNHSCSPNCETQKWMVNGELCIGIYALTDVKQSDELTFDYNFERYGDNPIKCYCATSKCGGWIGAAKASDNEGAAHDDEDGDYDLDPEPVMLEADEEKIKEEELKGREARGKSRVSRRGGGADDARWKPPKKSNVDYNGEEDEDYDQDEMMPAKKRADDSVNGGGGSGGTRSAHGSGT
uniref:Histone-lysine N-methyltransferase n=1 Tax=Mantoniella antarctica TaxID=81844 RepID=A0A7S0SAI4_9CHLO|mmetsp:Transcript_14880/g.36518  ORF Transcript_14880/g.36518 Transcript_14880/m.36518 type:complete len:456 (+) Transcript_14880:216-1583(+)